MVRISTAQSFDTGVERLQKRQADLAQAQERLTSGKRVRSYGARKSDCVPGPWRDVVVLTGFHSWNASAP